MKPNTIFDITKAPYHADATGHGDCTGAICRARLPFVPVVYFPEGTYLISDTLCYRRKNLLNDYGSDMNQQIRLRGAGAGKTVIRLADQASGFEAGRRKPVVSYMPGLKSNVAMSNDCEDLTIHCGNGNPGAVGLDFFANNSGAVRNLRVLSGDGKGFAGIRLGHSAFSGILIKHVEVDGFDHGIHLHSDSGTMFVHVEDILARNQGVSGVTVGAISISIRNLRTRNVPSGLTCTDPVGFSALVDSVLAGTGPKASDRQAGFLYASNVDTAGFGDARHIDTWVHPPATDGKGMPRLPIEETPIHVASGPSTGIRCFGAIGNGINDDSPAIQRALDSGAAEVCFEPGRYLMNRPVAIPSHVEHIDFGFCDLVAGLDLTDGTPSGIENALLTLYTPFHEWTYRNGGREFRGLRTERHTYVRTLIDGPWLLYDNIEDPFQMHNLADDPACAELVAQLDGHLAERLEAVGDDFAPGNDIMQREGYACHPNGQPKIIP